LSKELLFVFLLRRYYNARQEKEFLSLLPAARDGSMVFCFFFSDQKQPVMTDLNIPIRQKNFLWRWLFLF